MVSRTMKPQSLCAAAIVLVEFVCARQFPLYQPPMGFNPWARYTTHINESIFINTVDAMFNNGMLGSGYNRINLDDGWSSKYRTTDGSLTWDPVKFPQGLPWLASYINGQTFWPGIYSGAGESSCGGYPGSLGHEQRDLDNLITWGFTYLKLDGCNVPGNSEKSYHEVYGKWHTLLDATPELVVFSDLAPVYFANKPNLTDWYKVLGWAQDYGGLGRHSTGVLTFNQKGSAWDSMLVRYNYHVRLARLQRANFFNDPDIINFDHPSYTLDEKKSHFALWCSLSAPLIISADITTLSQLEVRILTNPDLIAIDQDPLAQQATLVSRDGQWDVLSKTLENSDRLLTILNRGKSTGNLTVPWKRLGFLAKNISPATLVNVRDLWTGITTKVPYSDGGVTAQNVPSHGTAVFRLSGAMADSDHPLITPTGMIFNTHSLKCLTDNSSGKVSWAKCRGLDAQVWIVTANGYISSLLRPDACLTDANEAILSSKAACKSDTWKYYDNGNLISTKTGRCLTETCGALAVARTCGFLTNGQVLALPVGNRVVETTAGVL